MHKLCTPVLMGSLKGNGVDSTPSWGGRGSSQPKHIYNVTEPKLIEEYYTFYDFFLQQLYLKNQIQRLLIKKMAYLVGLD